MCVVDTRGRYIDSLGISIVTKPVLLYLAIAGEVRVRFRKQNYPMSDSRIWRPADVYSTLRIVKY